MSDSLITDLSRSPDAELRRVGAALAPLSPTVGRGAPAPRASEALAEFLAVPPTSSVGSDGIAAPAPVPDLVIHLGRPASTTRRRARLLGIPTLLGGGLFAKAVLGATVVLAAGAGLAAVTGPIGHDTVVVTPSSPTATSTPTAPASPMVDDDHEGRGHAGDADDGLQPRTERPAPTRSVPSAQLSAAPQGRGQGDGDEAPGTGSDGGAGSAGDDAGSDDSSDEGSDGRATSGSDDGDTDPVSGVVEPDHSGSSDPAEPVEVTPDGGGDSADD